MIRWKRNQICRNAGQRRLRSKSTLTTQIYELELTSQCVSLHGSDGPSVSFPGEFSPNFDLKIYDFVLCKGFFTKEQKDPSSPDFEFFFPNRQIFLMMSSS
jgi:hypothetical protein